MGDQLPIREQLRAFDPAGAARLDHYDREMRFWKRMIWVCSIFAGINAGYVIAVVIGVLRHS